MNKLTKYDNSKSLSYVQSIEKTQDNLLVRKNLAVKLGLTTIGEFVEGRAVVHKDGKRMLLNEQGEFMRDDTISNLTKKKTTKIIDHALVREEYQEDGNGDIIQDGDPTTNIVKTGKWIFPPKDGIIIVVDDRKYSPGTRLYTTEGKRIPIPTGRDFDYFAILGLHAHDEFSQLGYYYRESISNAFDYRKNIIEKLIPVDLRHNYWNGEEDNLRKIYNLYNGCGYTLINTTGEFLKTELGYYYANTKRGFDFSHGLYPTIDPSFDNEFLDERLHYDVSRPVFYMVNKEGKAFRDEKGEIIYSDDPYRINHFNKDGFTILQIEPQVWSPDKGEKDPFLCFLHTSGSYLKNPNGTIKKIYFKKYIYSGAVPDPDVRGYYTHGDAVKVLIDRDKEDNRIYKTYTYAGEEIAEDNQEKIIQKLNFGPEGIQCYNSLGGGLIEYGYNTKKDNYHSGEEFFYGGERRIIHTHFNNQLVKFPDGSLCGLGCFGDKIAKYKDGYVFCCRGEKEILYSFVKINGLIARYGKDNEGNELKGLYSIDTLGENFLAIQFNKDEPYYILDKKFTYIKDNHGNKITSKRSPLSINGQILIYNSDPKDGPSPFWMRYDMCLEGAYFEDGTRVGEIPLELPKTTSDVIGATKRHMIKLL